MNDRAPADGPRITRFFALALAWLGFVAMGHACTDESPSDTAHRPVSHTYRSTPQRDLELTVYTPSDRGHEAAVDADPDAEAAAQPLRPGIVLFHGGGWFGGSNSQLAPLAMTLVDHGIIVVCATYRMEKRDKTKPIDALDDALHAMAWVRQHAEKLGIDPAKIAAGGNSAGAHLAAACATVPDDRLPADLPASPRPDLLLLFNPVLDNGPTETGYAYDRVGEDYLWFSPSYNVRPGLPPTLVTLGAEDDLIPVAVATEFQAAMEKHGNTCETEIYPGQGHGLLFNPSHKIETMRRGIAFLMAHGWIVPSQPHQD